MSQNQYQAQQLSALLESIQNKQVSGVLYLDAEISPERQPRSRVLIWRDGRMIYGGSQVPDIDCLIKILKQKLGREWVGSAVAFAMRQTTSEASMRPILERLVEMQLFSWEQIENVLYQQLILTLEQVLPYSGKFRFERTTEFNFCRGTELSKLLLDVSQRQEQWFLLRPLIGSMNAVPQIPEHVLSTITDANVRSHLQQWVDGQRSLVDIGEGLSKDPLSIGKAYLSWVQSGWVIMKDLSQPLIENTLPKILAVDDSAVMQKLIKRALTGYYQVIVASNAVDALNLIYHEEISLLLLDVSMPEIDGLELCRTIRSIAQFRNLPIIMVTARDGFFDKVKGKFAGSTDYLTKPFDADKLRQTVSKYLNAGVAASPVADHVELDLSPST